ncbi:hypothetical protein HR060_17815 [Catenovulum sp. SM1970]|uniref:competence protein CoiA family protein n=1 Tax=Marinifaba aquimaris TaxID=2741323 RepID=UPI001574DA0C|nr:competence protein CoiA family protein [Marinifaba aquimaris]NTS78703.1 hypothetical protein [Marinifaba aquimaris]
MNLINNSQQFDVDINKETTELKYAVNEIGDIKHISEVERGLSCNCICPYCKSALVAKKGDIKSHHFAHHNGEDCLKGGETMLHLMSKQILMDEKRVMTHGELLQVNAEDALGFHHELTDYIATQVLQGSDAVLEPNLGSYRPDVSLNVKGTWLDIEIFVTHQVDDDKATQQSTRKRDMLEIDLSQLPRDLSMDELKEQVLYLAPRNYIYGSNREAKLEALTTKVNQTISHINQIEEKRKQAESNAITVATDDSVTILGFKFGSGFSNKRHGQQDFSIGHLFCLSKVQDYSTRNFTLSASGGYEVISRDASDCLIETLKTYQFPIQAKLEYSPKPDMGNKFVVSGLTIVTS